LPSPAVLSVPRALVASAADKPMPIRLVATSRRFRTVRCEGTFRRPRVAPSCAQDPLVGSVVVGRVFCVGAFVIGQLAKDVEIAVEVDIDSGAVILGDLDLVVALFVTDLGAGHAASVGVLERCALGLLDVRSRGLLRRVVAGGVGDSAGTEGQHDRCGRRAGDVFLPVDRLLLRWPGFLMYLCTYVEDSSSFVGLREVKYMPPNLRVP